MTDPRPATVAAVLAVNFMTDAAHVVTGILLASMLVLMTLDVITAFAAHKGPSHLDWRALVKDKYFALILVVVSFVMDVVVYASVMHLPGEFPLIESGMPFITLASLTWFIGAEVFQIIARYTERGNLGGTKAPPHLAFMAERIQWMFRNIRKVDEQRWRRAHHDDGTLPPKRWPEDLTQEELAEVLAKVEQLSAKDVPPNPREILDNDVDTLKDGGQ